MVGLAGQHVDYHLVTLPSAEAGISSSTSGILPIGNKAFGSFLI